MAPVERQSDRRADGAAVTVRFGEHVERLALRRDGRFALVLPLGARYRADRGGDFRQEGAFLDKGFGGLVHPHA